MGFLYKSKRVGKFGQKFILYKFRTMKIFKIITIILGILIAGIIIAAQIQYKVDLKREQEQVKEDQRKVEMESLREELQTIKNKKPQIITKTVTIDNTKYVSGGSNDPDLPSIIAEWTPRVAFVVCKWNYYGIYSGSATLASLQGIGIAAMTNKHVINVQGYIPNACVISTAMGDFAIDWTQNVSTYQNPYYWGDYEDYGYLRIDNANQELRNLTSVNVKLCTTANIGDKLVVLGYPGIGSSDTITATEGIISGIEQNYYVTSAKIEHGNSGGAAILLKDDCYLGIPSYGEVGSAETLGRILKANFVIH